MLQSKMKKQKWNLTLISVLVCAAILNFGVSAAHRTLLQRGIAEKVLRFHILANSDSREDQDVKYQVRDAVLEWFSGSLPETDETDSGTGTKEAGLRFLAGHLREIEQIADQVLREQGMDYRAKAAVENCYFPERTYGDCTFPAGWYDALRLCLGEAEGHNWWCVLYPGLCFSDCLHAVVKEEEFADLRDVLTAEEYESLLHSPDQWKIVFRWF